MRTMETDVVVIGGGSTGAGVVRDVAMRGFRAILLDRADMAQGTSGRYHGLLHSGARYIASDPESATECAEENAIVSRINADAVEKTGGLFVTTSVDDEDYADQFIARAIAAHVPAEEISPAEALRRDLIRDSSAHSQYKTEPSTAGVWSGAQRARPLPMERRSSPTPVQPEFNAAKTVSKRSTRAMNDRAKTSELTVPLS